jgi:hypothetical protein
MEMKDASARRLSYEISPAADSRSGGTASLMNPAHAEQKRAKEQKEP